MARPINRIADLPWGQMTQFVTRLHNAGLTGDHVRQLLDDPELLARIVDAAKSLFEGSAWGAELYYVPAQTWNTIAPGVEMRRSTSHCDKCDVAEHVAILRLDLGGSLCREPEAFRLHDSWQEVSPGVQARRAQGGGIIVRTLKSATARTGSHER